jgi:ABC-2 type transport system permease protein
MRLRTGTRRSGAVFSAITGLVFYGFWTMLAWGAASYFADPDHAANFLPVLSSGLAFVMLYWQVAPVISAGFGASLDLRKLLAYPIPHGKMFTVEILLRITSCAEMPILIAGAAVGLLRNPVYGLRATPFILGAALIFIATNILLAAGARYLLERLFLHTRLREAMLVLLVLAGVAPQVLIFMDIRKAALFRFAPSQFFWPWGAAARLMLRGDSLNATVLSAGFAVLYFAAAYSFGRWQFERSIRYDAASLKKPERDARSLGIAEVFFRLPARLLPDPLAALVEKELRTFARIPRFRMAYAMSCMFGIVVFLPMLRSPEPESFMVRNALPLLALYGLLMLGPITYWNAFGFDRSAAQGYFCWPVRFRDALMAKNIAVAMLLIPQIFMIAIVGRAAHLPASPGKLCETIVVILIASLYWFSMGNICSVRIPRAMDPEKMNQMANKLQALSIWTAPVLLLPIGLAYWARAVFGNELVFAAMLLVAAVIGGVFYRVGLDSAANAAGRRREAILLQLSRSDGPLSVT